MRPRTSIWSLSTLRILLSYPPHSASVSTPGGIGRFPGPRLVRAPVVARMKRSEIREFGSPRCATKIKESDAPGSPSSRAAPPSSSPSAGKNQELPQHGDDQDREAEIPEDGRRSRSL